MKRILAAIGAALVLASCGTPSTSAEAAPASAFAGVKGEASCIKYGSQKGQWYCVATRSLR